MSRSARRVELPIAGQPAFHPRYVVWELTLRCDQPCTHCGSRAGDPRASELSTEEALRVVDDMKKLGTEEVVLIGGEAYLHPGYLDIVAALSKAGIRATMTTGGRGVDRALAEAAKKAGLVAASVSIDGLEKTHDLMRAVRGSFRSATAALGHLRAAGITITANTNVNRLNRGDLEGLYEHLREAGIRAWQIQITTPLGRAADRPDLVLQPYDLLDVVPRVAALKERAFRDDILVMPGNNLGYFGPEEAVLRSIDEGGEDHWFGCQAGKYVMGIESDGAVKGCPSLQTSHYVGGRTDALAASWEASRGLAHEPKELWGFCATCDFKEPCGGGCTFTAHAVFGKPGNNPYCHYRARTLRNHGRRERLVLRQNAPGLPFDNGEFDLISEPFDAPETIPTRPLELVQIRRIRP